MAVDRFPIEAGHIMIFARSAGDPNPIYYDVDHAGSSEVGRIIAPPTFVQAAAQFDPDYPLRPKIGQPWFGSGREPSGAAGGGGGQRDSASAPPGGGVGRGLHAEQHFEYHRPLGVGDVLSVTTRPGATWEKEGRRAGRLTFAETITEYRNQDGDLVVTARSVGVRTERAAAS